MGKQGEPAECSLIVFHAPLVGSPLVQAVGAAQRAASLDVLRRAAQLGFRHVVLAGADEKFAHTVAALGLDVALELDVDSHFHFGRRLAAIVDRHRLDRFIYIGGGAAPLLSEADLLTLLGAVSGEVTAAAANNLFSADIVALGPNAAEALRRISPPQIDNALAYRLREVGIATPLLAPTLGLNFDIDTPTDLAVLAFVHEYAPSVVALGSHLQAVLREYQRSDLAARQWAAMQAAFAVMQRREGEIICCGRINATTWRRLEVALPCQTRVLGEERGMRASGREERGEVRSLLGLLLEHIGGRATLADLAQTAQAAFIDTRVLFNHLHLHLTIDDRFASDVLRWEDVTNSAAREFTQAVAEAAIPIVLGGHSLIAGGLNLLAALVQELQSGQLQ